MVHTKRCCLNIDFIYVTVDCIILEANSSLRILVPWKIDKSLDWDDYTGGKIWFWVLDTFIDRSKNKRKVARIQERIMEMIVWIEARISTEDRMFPFILLRNKNLRSKGNPSRTSVVWTEQGVVEWRAQEGSRKRGHRCSSHC